MEHQITVVLDPQQEALLGAFAKQQNKTIEQIASDALAIQLNLLAQLQVLFDFNSDYDGESFH